MTHTVNNDRLSISQNPHNSFQKIIGFDYLRVICAIGVVGIHSLDTNDVLRQIASSFQFAVPVFLMISFFLLCKKTNFESKKTGFYIVRKIQRLLPSYIVWTLIYLGVRLLFGNNLEFSFSLLLGYLLIGGAAIQLYYIPLTIYYTIALLPIIQIIKIAEKWKSYLILISILLLVASSEPLLLEFNNNLNYIDYQVFLKYAITNAIYPVFGICFVYLFSQERTSGQNKKEVFLRYCLLAIAIITVLFCSLSYPNKTRLLSGLVLFSVFYFISVPNYKIVSLLSRLSFGIYFSHHIFIELFQEVEQKIGWDLSSFRLTLINFALGLIVSICASLILYRNPKTRFMVA